MNKTKAVLFDFDGTLIDSVNSVWREYQRTASILKLPKRTFKDFARQLGRPWKDALLNLWPEVDAGEFTRVYRLGREQAKAIDGVVKTLGRLKGRYKIGIMTSRGSRTLYKHLKSAGIDESMFEVILHGDSLRKTKPNADALYQACGELRVKPSEVVYAGDSVVDAECALAAGIRFIGVLTGGASRQDFLQAGIPRRNIIPTLKSLPEKLDEPA